MGIKENVQKIFSDIPSNIKVVAATKNQETEKIEEAVKAGIEIIGENRIQEATKKFKEINFPVKKHFIGHLQSNKAKKAAELFDCIQSLDSLKTAKKLDSACISLNKKMPVFLELNLGEKQKFGLQKNEIFEFAESIQELSFIELKGLMFMAPFFEKAEETSPFFAEAKKVFDNLKRNHSIEFLSMGMSNDYVYAIKNGSNMIRIGRKIFEC
jgi:hypothetical protein